MFKSVNPYILICNRKKTPEIRQFGIYFFGEKCIVTPNPGYLSLWLLFALKVLVVLKIWFSSALKNYKTVSYKHPKICTIFQFEKLSFCLVAILVTFRWILVNVSVHKIKISVVNFRNGNILCSFSGVLQ